MKPVRYVLLSPSGNLTALVTGTWETADEPEITRRLLQVSEQVAYLEKPTKTGVLARVRLMGGEFCGNAAMAAAGWLIRDRLLEGMEETVPLEVSGTRDILPCRIRGRKEGFEGTVPMPPILEIWSEARFGIPLMAVRMEGILHLVRESDTSLEKEAAENLLKAIAAQVPDAAVGLLDRNAGTGAIRPLVFVRGSGSLVWETACGSGTAAIGAVEAMRQGKTAETAVPQPGGIIRASAVFRKGQLPSVSITGAVKILSESDL